MKEFLPAADELARQFHEAYERLAPEFGYETRKESAKPWTEVPEQNKQLMRAVMVDVMAPLLGWPEPLFVEVTK